MSTYLATPDCSVNRLSRKHPFVPHSRDTPAADNWGLESWLTQIAWMRTLGREGGLFFTIGRKDDLAEMRVRQLTAACPRI